LALVVVAAGLTTTSARMDVRLTRDSTDARDEGTWRRRGATGTAA
jgi:hypothetical protein